MNKKIMCDLCEIFKSSKNIIQFKGKFVCYNCLRKRDFYLEEIKRLEDKLIKNEKMTSEEINTLWDFKFNNLVV
jgi:hypothetical protein